MAHYFRYGTSCVCYVTSKQGRQYLPQVQLQAHTSILSSTSRTTLTQNFVNPSKEALDEVRYTFPLYDGVSVVGFTCTIGDRMIHGVVKEKQSAKETYDAAVQSGETAGLLEQSESASDVFSTTLGNVPAGETIVVKVTYLGELKHDAEVDGLRFTIPTAIAPRYSSSWTSIPDTSSNVSAKGISITVDVEVPIGNSIKAIQSPSHPIAVDIGTTSTAPNADPSLQKASASLALGSTELDKDFIVTVVVTNFGTPTAVLETHPSLPNQRALMTTLVPKFNIPSQKPEIVFICDRSGSMTGKIANLIDALHLFLKSLPVGVKFNICSFGSHHDFLWEKSQTYGSGTLKTATDHIKGFSADYGGTKMLHPVEETFKRRYKDMNLEVFLLTDGEIWDQAELFKMVNNEIVESDGAIRVFTLGVGHGVSHALIEGVARAGNGFSQTVSDNEKMDKKVIRMLKASLTPHIKDYALEIKYKKSDDTSDGFELVEKVRDTLTLSDPEEFKNDKSTKEGEKISLFDTSAKDTTTDAPSSETNKSELLKDVHEGRFPDMVEREAVRLGLRFQVAGKWTSFVAVKANGDQMNLSKGDDQKAVLTEMHEEDLSDEVIGFGLMDGGDQMDLSLCDDQEAVRTEMHQEDLIDYSDDDDDVMGFALMDYEATPGPPPAPAPAASFVTTPVAPRKRVKMGSIPGRPHALPSCFVDQEASVDESEDEDDSHKPTLARIVNLQQFSGQWEWTEKLFEILGVSSKEVAKRKIPGESVSPEVLATACAVVFLKKKLPEEEDAWEMLVDKAREWLEAETGLSAEGVEKVVEDLFN